MYKVKELSVSIGMTINVGNYSSVKIEEGMSVLINHEKENKIDLISKSLRKEILLRLEKHVEETNNTMNKIKKGY